MSVQTIMTDAVFSPRVSRRVRFRPALVAAGLMFGWAAPAAADAPLAVSPYTALRDVDARLAAIAFRLATANAPLCRDLQPATGIVLHAIDQYPDGDRTAVRAAFAFPTPVSVELVVPGSPGERAGVTANDGLVTVRGAPVAAPAGGKAITSATRDAALARLADGAPDAAIAVTLARGEARLDRVVRPVPACRAEFEAMAGNVLGASSDGRVVQVAGRLLAMFDDDQVAVVVAHELSHAILRHRARLEAAGVTWGLLSELGRNGRLFRQTETEADILGAFLLRNAGYDPQSAVRFWREQGGKVDGGLFRSRTHPSSKDRAAAIAAALAAMPADAPAFYEPPVLAARDQPLQ